MARLFSHATPRSESSRTCRTAKNAAIAEFLLLFDSDDNLKSVCDRLKANGYHFFAIGLFLQIARKNVLLIGFTVDFVALLALTVACLGITNTMFTAVLERTKEIGVMKAVGAKDRHVLSMFLAEGAMIGLIGGWLGVLVGWLVSFPGDNVALRLIREQDPDMPTPETVFRYPLWLIVGAPVLAILVTTVAGLLPARRASRIEPVVALRRLIIVNPPDPAPSTTSRATPLLLADSTARVAWIRDD